MFFWGNLAGDLEIFDTAIFVVFHIRPIRKMTPKGRVASIKSQISDQGWQSKILEFPCKTLQ
ncbi:hypothetical protein D1AOALGA4SA_6375 [Olavius algarvensis Delta 1 endosymbiont]|nr:hypothetical protein D1AOALGA4SA_6375 [Olavius algarvensis Delta 1 endosymbiont]